MINHLTFNKKPFSSDQRQIQIAAAWVLFFNRPCLSRSLPILNLPKNVWVNCTDPVIPPKPVIPAHAGIQMLRTMINHLTFNKKPISSDQRHVQIAAAWVLCSSIVLIFRLAPILLLANRDTHGCRAIPPRRVWPLDSGMRRNDEIPKDISLSVTQAALELALKIRERKNEYNIVSIFQYVSVICQSRSPTSYSDEADLLPCNWIPAVHTGMTVLGTDYDNFGFSYLTI